MAVRGVGSGPTTGSALSVPGGSPEALPGRGAEAGCGRAGTKPRGEECRNKGTRQEYRRTTGAKAVGPAKALSADPHLIHGVLRITPHLLGPPEVR